MSSLDMGEAIKMLANEKNISVDTLLHVLVDALATAYKGPWRLTRWWWRSTGHVRVHLLAYDVDDGTGSTSGDDTSAKEELGRIAAQTFRQVMSQRIREAEAPQVRGVRQPRGDIVTGIIQQADDRYTSLDLGRWRASCPRPSRCRPKPVPGDRRRPTRGGPQDGQRPADRGRRTHPGLIKRLFELEVLEIATASWRSGLRPRARPPHQDRRVEQRPQIPWVLRGARGGRAWCERTGGEKIDIVLFSEDSLTSCQGAVAGQGEGRHHLRRRHPGRRDRARRPAQPGHRQEGQNARLAARLHGASTSVASQPEDGLTTTPTTKRASGCRTRDR